MKEACRYLRLNHLTRCGRKGKNNNTDIFIPGAERSALFYSAGTSSIGTFRRTVDFLPFAAGRHPLPSRIFFIAALPASSWKGFIVLKSLSVLSGITVKETVTSPEIFSFRPFTGTVLTVSRYFLYAESP